MLEAVLSTLKSLNAPASLLDAFTTLEEKRLRGFIGEVDESPYSLNEWCEAIIAFEEWAIQNKRSPTLQWKLEYLYCCVQGTASEGRLQSLKAVWETYVQNYGVI